MTEFFKIVISLTIIFALTPYASGIKCFDCRSNNDPKCADPFDNSSVPMTDCEQLKGLPDLPDVRPTMCRKIGQKVNGELVISRGCTWKRADDYSTTCPSTSNGPNDFASFCETCDYNGCNGAGALAKTAALLLAPVALLLFK